jgi:replication-associated recombination protein RarA
MLDGGADPRYLARRIVRMASEDIGLADPRRLQLALRCRRAPTSASGSPRANSRWRRR